MSGAPTFIELLRGAVTRSVQDLHVALPGSIEDYDAATQKASVKPLIKVPLADGTSQSLPVIPDVPVVWPRGGGALLSFPLERGDGVLLVFSERSLDEWLSQGGEVAPEDPRTHHLTDAIALPGLSPFSDASQADARDVVLRFNETEVRLAKAGDFSVQTPGGFLRVNKDGTCALGGAVELVSVIDALLDQLIAMTTTTSLGPQPPINLPAFVSLKARLALLREKT